ncbi:hypothetical protein AS9A_1389 [Hoyosella subflava DQS3-9A1]|uniref:Biotin synthase auxiliary protein n=1 Tax=Hoyosella subflava (strain DSM 45089 / JCM 17490 / NBRC 109087 / DQS3-9A1) TaxID=443218 RepID=F6EGB6_HOYSD|nr:hypothetical protein AS9A_1389 [Hoyosella subflava DQS3-9A1]
MITAGLPDKSRAAREVPAKGGGPLGGEQIYNVYTGTLLTEGAALPTAAQLGLEPPRFCGQCGRRMVVQVDPIGWWGQCSRHGRVYSSELG